MFLQILLNILAPILLMVLLGALMRHKFKLDMGTLNKLNIYLFSPAFVFDKVSNSVLSWSAMGGVVVITVMQVLTLGVIVWIIGRALKLERKMLAAVALAVMFYNSGNYGLPLAQLAYPAEGVQGSEVRVQQEGDASSVSITSAATSNSAQVTRPTQSSMDPEPRPLNPPSDRDGGAVQAFVVLCQNLLTFTVGLMLAGIAGGTGDIRQGLIKVFRMPVFPVLGAALLARWWMQNGGEMPVMISACTKYLSDGLVPVALVTLGAQMAVKPRWPKWGPVGLVLLLRLGFGPIQMGLLLWGFHKFGLWTGTPALDLWPWPAELLILTAAVPTAVTTLLLTLELDGDAELAADCVFWTTVGSMVSIPVWVYVIRVWMT